MKWNKYTLKTTSKAEDIVISTLADLGIQGVEIEDKQPLTEEDKRQMFVDILPDMPEDDGVAYLNFYLEPGLIGDEHLPNSARPAWEMMYETVVKKAEETEGYAGSALASKRAAAASEAAAGTSATNAARDAKSAHAAKTAVESLGGKTTDY